MTFAMSMGSLAYSFSRYGHMPGMFRIIFPSAVMGEVGLPENIFFLVDF